MAVTITDEIRQAVLAAECEARGHDFNLAFTFQYVGEHGPQRCVLSNPDPKKAPHLICTRCDRVWLIVEEGGVDYDDAEATLIERLAPADPLGEYMSERRTSRRQHPRRTPPEPVPPIAAEPDLPRPSRSTRPPREGAE